MGHVFVLKSGIFYEHYFELSIIIIGLILYVKIGNIKFKLHPKYY